MRQELKLKQRFNSAAHSQTTNIKARFCRIYSVAVILAILLSSKIARASDVESAFVSFEAQFAYATHYVDQKGAKSFAIGPCGNFATGFDKSSQKRANSRALASCNKSVANDAAFFSVKIKAKCVLFAEADNILLPGLWEPSKWQAPAIGVDKPLNTGSAFRYHGDKPTKGILLVLHGCDRNSGGIVNKVWGKYINSLGLSLFIPSSFADPRPEAICGVTPLKKRKESAEIMRIRLSQAIRNIERIKSENPSLPIFVWGHSEGSFVAMALESQVNGVILSGEECDAYGLPIATPENVPVLLIYGESDPFFNGVELPLTLKKLQKCAAFLGKRNYNIAIVKKSAHYIRPWRPEVAEAFSKFLTGTIIPPPTAAKHLLLPLSVEGEADMVDHKSRGKHKAIAVHSDGTFASYWDVDYKIDAENFAAFDCDFRRGVDPFITGEHTCSIQVVDDVVSPSK
jgi:hypothetical protein